ncbi:NADH dehydrogenase [ubiquinone] iron-sulfur protein 6, mitochondrial-like [Actinia tenebrosa]|uniref:NADH dehydrogenase [ubiquinone] iron-sulfur protein 6, mitochondrial n=1 Tax=Actinia tenebrosa TaxID=6105 RepID=A0A6P8I700_ACTTE|nr:NADH dehydrogenase [ubiquinone] iron-sulfur protein 6, mitochondrial-like [Actinia tenebrosa]
MAAALIGLRRLVTRTSLRSVVVLQQNFKNYATQDTVTHTGQAWDSKDYRNKRFTDRNKEVNMNFGINLVAEEPPIEVKGRSVYCDGGGGPLGHPKVYINLDQDGPHPCGYCGLRFIKAKDSH